MKIFKFGEDTVTWEALNNGLWEELITVNKIQQNGNVMHYPVMPRYMAKDYSGDTEINPKPEPITREEAKEFYEEINAKRNS